MVDLFKGRSLAIATMHGKEQVIGPVIEKALGVKTILPVNFNTDDFGTFAGEKARHLTPLETAIAKAKKACELTGCTLAVASEGSFGPHPTLYFMSADDEVMVLVDTENDLHFKARLISTTTNFNGEAFNNWQEVKAFADKTGFPAHALMVRKNATDLDDLVKGINSWTALENLAATYMKNYGSAFLETDMRAMHNPTRMKVIEQVTQKLMDVILNDCPRCKAPGYDICEVVQGLPCSECGSATKATLAYQYKCNSCNYASIKEFPNGKAYENPQFCDYCNP